MSAPMQAAFLAGLEALVWPVLILGAVGGFTYVLWKVQHARRAVNAAVHVHGCVLPADHPLTMPCMINGPQSPTDEVVRRVLSGGPCTEAERASVFRLVDDLRWSP